ncbi:MAG: O-antigen ligase family protein [Gaiellaceae bacterium]
MGRATLAAVAALLVATLFFGGGSSDEPLFWIGCGAIALASALGIAALLGVAPVPGLDAGGLAFAGGLAGFVVWNGASIGWSIVPDRSWDYLNRGLVYLCFAAAGLFLGAALPRAPRVLAAVLATLLALVLGWALLTRAVPGLFPDGVRIARLRNPIGYWNALALVADMALALSLWLASGPRRLRARGTMLAYAAVVVLLLTYSRGGIAVAVVVVAGWLLLGRARGPSTIALAVAVPTGLAVGAIAFALPGLDAGEAHGARVRDGILFALTFVAGAVVVRLAGQSALRRAGLPGEGRRTAVAAAAMLAGVGVLCVTGLAVRAGGPGAWWRDFTNPVEVGQGSSRLESASSNNRWTWWGEAWQVFEGRPVAGAGAASFGVARRPIRENESTVGEPHNMALQFLAELGVVGLALALTAAAGAAVAVRSTLRRLDGEDRSAALALALGAAAYGLHALVDYDWDFVAVTAPALLVLGCLVAAGRRSVRLRRRPLAAAGVAVVALAAVYSLGAPWLADRRLGQAGEALARAPAVAAAKARSAHRLNPLAVEPLHVWASAETLRGDDGAALRLYEEAVELQPENWETWYLLGGYEFDTGRFERACYALDLAYRLDPRGKAGRPGDLLDQVKQRLPGCPGVSGRR